jgi:hypothetical protein
MAKDDKRSMVKLGNADLSFDEALEQALKIQTRGFAQSDKPDLDGVKKAILQTGTYVTKVVTCWDIRSRHTGEYKFSNLVLATLRRTKSRGWEFETHRSITLGDSKNTEVIQKLTTFLQSLPQIEAAEDVIVFSASNFDSAKFKNALQAISGTGRSASVLSEILSWINEDNDALENLARLSSDDLLRSRSLVAAINYGRYHGALSQFRHMLDQDLPEREYQRFLKQNHWIFGSEYSELLDKRNLVVGQQLDFPLRRTVDGYLDVIEIKTPLKGKSGFIRDASHDNYYPGSDIHKHTQQVLNYLSALEADRHRIMAQDKIDVTKVRGKLIVGRDGSKEEQEARRLYNSNQRSVEVMSFDGLIRVGERILKIMVTEYPELASVQIGDTNIKNIDDGIPF